MLVEAIERPIRYQLLSGHQVRLTPGCPIDLPEGQARMLLAKAPGRVRAVGSDAMDGGALLIEPAECRPVFWENVEKQIILGPGTVTDVIKEISSNGQVHFWLCLAYGGSWRWIHESLLRSRATYEANWGKSKSVVVR